MRYVLFVGYWDIIRMLKMVSCLKTCIQFLNKNYREKKIFKAFAIVSQNKHQTGVEYWKSRLIGFALEAANT